MATMIGNNLEEHFHESRHYPTNLVICTPASRMEIQIDDNDPFVPDELIEAGIYFGFKETTAQNYKVRNYRCTRDRIVVLHFVVNKIEEKRYFKKGYWESGNDNLPRFHVYELLED